VVHRKGSRASSTREETVGAVPMASRLVVIVSCIAALSAMVRGWGGAGSTDGTFPQVNPSSAASAVAPADSPPPAGQSVAPAATVQLVNTPPSSTVHVGIVAGHWGSDTGATCPDGLTEVEINLDVAGRVVNGLRTLGYQADLLEEMDSRLEGYRADALVSIHADSCVDYPDATPPASGFKVASVEDSLVPEAEARLVACLAQCYAARTGMFFHTNSITYDMIYYHSFYEIDGQTPGAIIETGFMLNDRYMLTERADRVAQGIVDGIVCFIEGEAPQ